MIFFQLFKKVFGETQYGFGFQKYFLNTGWLLVEKTLKIFSALFVGVWVVRYLGPTDYGILAYAQSFVAIFAVLSTLGLDSIVIKELVQDKTERDKLIGTVFWLKVCGAFGVLAILAVAVNFTSNDYLTNIMVFILASGTIFQSFNVIDLYFQSKVMSKYVVYSNIISLVISSLLKIAFIIYEAPLITFVWVTLFDSFILSIGFIYFFIKHSKFRIKNLKFKREIAISLLRDSWPLLFSSMVVTIYMKIDQIMIKEMLNPEAVGQYAAAVKLSEVFYFIPVAIISSVFPAIINAKKISEKLYEIRFQMLYDLMFWMAIAIAISMIFFNDWLINLLYGNQYNQSASVLIIHIWSGVFVFLGVASGKWLIVENLQKYTMINTTIGAIINVIINLILIPKIGVNGAAWATLISYFSAAYLLLFFPKKTRSNFYALSKTLIISRYIKKNFNVKKNN